MTQAGRSISIKCALSEEVRHAGDHWRKSKGRWVKIPDLPGRVVALGVRRLSEPRFLNRTKGDPLALRRGMLGWVLGITLQLDRNSIRIAVSPGQWELDRVATNVAFTKELWFMIIMIARKVHDELDMVIIACNNQVKCFSTGANLVVGWWWINMMLSQ